MSDKIEARPGTAQAGQASPVDRTTAAGETPAARTSAGGASAGGASAGGLVTLVYGGIVYAFFLATFAYTVGFVENARLTVGGVSLFGRTLDRGTAEGPTVLAIIVDLAVLALFAVQHSLMARQGFKRWWTRFVPASVERSTYVLFATGCLVLILLLWRPVGLTLWDVSRSWARILLVVISLLGWALVLLSTFLINHGDLFGLRQVLAAARRRQLPPDRMVTPLWYRVVRHPIYLGFLIAFWSAPTMTLGHLIFALATTGYILVGIRLEERDLITAFGEDYRAYRRRVSMLIPYRRSGG